jgi:hypothetical protein
MHGGWLAAQAAGPGSAAEASVSGIRQCVPPGMAAAEVVRVRVEIMGSPECRIVGRSQSVLIMSNPIICTRTRRSQLQVRRSYGDGMMPVYYSCSRVYKL